jgi:nucleoside-diphosphate kinase
MAIERTLSIIKPDAVAKNVIGKIYSRFETNGLKVIAAKLAWLSPQEAGAFYAVHKERPFFKDLVSFMISGPVMIQVLEGENAIAKNRELMGATDPKKAEPGTIRADFAESIDANAVHGSDGEDTAKVEIAFFFPAMNVYSGSLGRASTHMTVNLLDLDAAGLTAFFAETRRKALSRPAGVALDASFRAG